MLQYIAKYGYIFLAIIVFLEYLNLPGLPAGIIMPAAGILIKSDGLSFIYTLIISVIAGFLGSFILYILGYYLSQMCMFSYSYWYAVKSSERLRVLYRGIW